MTATPRAGRCVRSVARRSDRSKTFPDPTTARCTSTASRPRGRTVRAATILRTLLRQVDDAELSEQPELVEDVPALDDQSIVHADDPHAFEDHSLPGRGKVQQAPLMGGGRRPSERDPVP